jgi:hypothetical protein
MNELNLYCSGRYALIDTFYRHIWLTVDDENAAHQIKKIFWGKVPTIVFDLTQFENYSDGLIDTDVCLDWLIEPAEYSSPLMAPSLTNPVYNDTQTTYSSSMLLNTPNKCPLPRSRQKDLQQEMILYFKFFPLLSIKLEHNISDTEKLFISRIDKIFQTELNISDIKEQIFQFGIDNYAQMPRLAYYILEFYDWKHE